MAKYKDTAPEIVWCAQLPALFVVVTKECWDVKNDIRNRPGRRSGQMVVKRYNTHGTRQKRTRVLKNRARVFCRVLYAVLWNILCPCTFSI